MRAMNMLGKAEEKVQTQTHVSLPQTHVSLPVVLCKPPSLPRPQYNDLLKKKEIVENDKAKIAELITELDQKKNEALRGAWERVNRVRR